MVQCLACLRFIRLELVTHSVAQSVTTTLTVFSTKETAVTNILNQTKELHRKVVNFLFFAHILRQQFYLKR